jgi:hypothetical protein
MDKNILLKNSSGKALYPATRSLKVTAFSVSSLNNYTDLVVYLPHGLIEFNVYGKSKQDNVYSITIGLPDDTRKNLYAMFGEILRTGTGAAKNNGNSETYMFTYDLAIGSTSGTLLIKLNKPITILTTSTITFTTNLNKFVTPSALGVLDGTDTNDTQPVHIDGTGKLWTAPGGGTEVTIDPNGGLQNTSTGLSIKGDSTAQGGPGIATGSTGTYSPISSDGKRGSIIGVRKTDQQTEAVGVGTDGKLYTKPIGGTGDIEIDPAGGLEKGSAGYGLMLAANSGLNVDEDGLKIKPDTAGRGSGLYVSTAGIRVSQSTNNALGGIVGTASTSTQTEAVGIDDQGRLYTKAIPVVSNALTLKIYVNSETGNDSNDGKTEKTAVQTLRQAFRLIPDVAGTVYIYATGEGEANAGFPYHAESIAIIGNETSGYTITSGLYFINCSNVFLRNITFTNKTTTLINVKTDCYISLWNCTIDQTYDSTTTPASLSLIKANANIGKVSVAIAAGSFNVNALCYSAQTLGHLEICLLTPDSASTIAKPLSRNNGSTPTGAIYLVTVPNEASIQNVTMPTVYTGARESYIITGNNIIPFQTTNTASDSFTDVYTNIIQGLKLNGQFVQAQFSFYGTTTKALNISDAATVLGTSSGLKGSFVAIGMMNYNAQKYPVFVQVNNSGNIELYRVGMDNIAIESGKTINISAIAVNYGGVV